MKILSDADKKSAQLIDTVHYSISVFLDDEIPTAGRTVT
jgi:hypothetical protein